MTDGQTGSRADGQVDAPVGATRASPAERSSRKAGFFREWAGVVRWPTRLEWRIARRYLRSRRGSRTASLNTVISTGGVAVGVTALIVVLGVMNGLRNDLRERILVANPHLRILTYGAGLRVDDWRRVVSEVRKQPGVVTRPPRLSARRASPPDRTTARG